MGGRHRREDSDGATRHHRRGQHSADVPLASSYATESNWGSVLFVCTGNIVRSAFAEHHAASLVCRSDAFSSAGVAALAGQGLHASMSRFFACPPKHSARQAQASILRRSPLVLTMSKNHLEWVAEEAPDVAGRTFLLKGFAEVLAVEPPPTPLPPELLSVYASAKGVPVSGAHGVADPLGGPPEKYQSCALEIDAALRSILPWLELSDYR